MDSTKPQSEQAEGSGDNRGEQPKKPVVEKTESPDGMMTEEQIDRIKKLVVSVGDTWGREQQVAWLQSRSYNSFRSLKVEEADDLIEQLLQIELGFKESMGN